MGTRADVTIEDVEYVMRHGDWWMLREIAEELRVSVAVVKTRVDQLEKTGQAQRHTDLPGKSKRVTEIRPDLLGTGPVGKGLLWRLTGVDSALVAAAPAALAAGQPPVPEPVPEPEPDPSQVVMWTMHTMGDGSVSMSMEHAIRINEAYANMAAREESD